ncbi:MAG: hypothetical protein MI923_08140 [Phycisphaerales bacterium]|nr:hypothetical protein [Phycisphaerales bacterium]
MTTETFDRARLVLSMEGSSALYRDELFAALAGLEKLSLSEAEDLVAIAGEDERAYALRDRNQFFETLCQRADEFLGDDDGGFHKMLVHITKHDRSHAALEIWFHVSTPGSDTGGVWFRHMVVGVDESHLYADMGPAAKSSEKTQQSDAESAD